MMRRTFNRPDLAVRETAKALVRCCTSWSHGLQYGSMYVPYQLRGIADGYQRKNGTYYYASTQISDIEKKPMTESRCCISSTHYRWAGQSRVLSHISRFTDAESVVCHLYPGHQLKARFESLGLLVVSLKFTQYNTLSKSK